MVDSDSTARALELLGLLKAGGHWTTAELANRLGVTARTVRRDIRRLRDLGYAVQNHPGPGSSYHLDPAVQIPPLLFTEDEITVMTAGLRLIQAWMPHEDLAATALLKLGQVLPRPARRRAAAIDLATEVLEQPSTAISAAIIGVIADTVAADGRLQFSYVDQHGHDTQRLVQPYRHVLRHGCWYLIAYDLGREDWRIYRLDRITDPQRIHGTFSPRPFPSSIPDWFATDFGRVTAGGEALRGTRQYWRRGGKLSTSPQALTTGKDDTWP